MRTKSVQVLNLRLDWMKRRDICFFESYLFFCEFHQLRCRSCVDANVGICENKSQRGIMCH